MDQLFRPNNDAFPKVHIFVGPSSFGTQFQSVMPGEDSNRPQLIWHPPAKRGDAIALLKGCETPGILALADGTFHSYPSIGHIELRQLLESGWIVIGMCSMGAIRACEMRNFGMRAYGTVAKRFLDDPSYPDDEVALVHGSEPPWIPLSEPLVHLRSYLFEMSGLGYLTSQQTHEVAEELRGRWYGERTLDLLRTLLARLCPRAPLPLLYEHIRHFKPYRLKQRDLESYISTIHPSTFSTMHQTSTKGL